MCMSIFCANRITRRALPSRLLFAPLMAALLLALPQSAHSQSEASDESFADPNQHKIDILLSSIKVDSPDTLKMNNYSKIAQTASNYDTAIKYAQLSLDFCKPTDRQLMANNYHIVGNALYMKEMADDALPNFFKEMDLRNQMSDKKGIAGACAAIGWCYEDLNIPDSTFKYFNKALNIHLEMHDTTGVSDIYRYIGEEYLHLSLYDNAEDNYLKALSYAEQSGNKLEMAMCYRSIGEMLVKESDTTIMRGIVYLKKSIELFEQTETGNGA